MGSILVAVIIRSNCYGRAIVSGIIAKITILSMYKKTSLFIFTVLTVLSYFVWEKPNCSHVFNVFLITLQKVDGNGIKKQKTKLNFVKNV